MVYGSRRIDDRVAWGRARVAFAGCLAIALVAIGKPAHAAFVPVCTAAQIVSAEGCAPSPSTANCNISGDYVTNQPSCTFDFGNRPVTVRGTSIIDAGPRALTIKASQLTVQEFGEIKAQGDAGSIVGGNITVITTGNVIVERVADIHVSSDDAAGDIFIDAGGSVLITGRLSADGNLLNSLGGTVVVKAQTTITVASTGLISAKNGSDAFAPGPSICRPPPEHHDRWHDHGGWR
jgi:hypothetical protein